jgi:hypothetical protein
MVGSSAAPIHVLVGPKTWAIPLGVARADILAYITGTVDQELLVRNEYLAAENRILRGQLKGRLRFSDAERAKLGEIGRRLGRKALGEVANADR